MATLGVFSRHEDCWYGSIQTLSLNTRVEIVPSGLEGEKAPQHRVVIGGNEIGAAWTRTNRDGGTYLAVKLDDPCLPGPIFANLVERGDAHHLIWSRDDARQA